ncbi:spore coat protein CotJB [Cohnella soli]|uniref:Spore coat protein CotJB n=1 Tax=Cohnella soli TaxID=425005 RepID=A0ABW0HPM9_9BACL
MAERNERADRPERTDKKKTPEQLERDNAAYDLDLLELQRVDFALVELTLYLDTHPTDMQAVQQFNQLAQRRQQLAAEFEMKYGPLMQFGHSFTRYPWRWAESPWPWQV